LSEISRVRPAMQAELQRNLLEPACAIGRIAKDRCQEICPISAQLAQLCKLPPVSPRVLLAAREADQHL